MKFEHDWLSDFGVGNYQRDRHFSNMVAKVCDLNKLCKTNRQLCHEKSHEIWAWSVQWFWQKTVFKDFWEIQNGHRFKRPNWPSQFMKPWYCSYYIWNWSVISSVVLEKKNFKLYLKNLKWPPGLELLSNIIIHIVKVLLYMHTKFENDWYTLFRNQDCQILIVQL